VNIDLHCHILTEEMLRLMQGVSKQYAPYVEPTEQTYTRVVTENVKSLILNIPSNGARMLTPIGGYDVAVRLEDMDRMRVDVQAMAQVPQTFLYDIPLEVNAQFARIINEGMAKIKQEYPGRFAPLAAVPLQDGQAAADELEHAVKVLGLNGVGTGTSLYSGGNLDEEHLEPFYAKLNELNVPWFIHPDRPPAAQETKKYYLGNFIGNPLGTTIAVCSLIFGGVLERYPNIRVWTPHAGGYVPYQFGRYDHGFQWREEPKAVIKTKPSTYLPQVMFDIIAHSKPALNYLVQTFGPEQVFLGTDYPYDMGIGDPVGLIDSIETTDEAGKALIKGGNAQKALGL
jgi:aminocarboxymuconate-semialdehyde decarboxylase